MKSYQPVNVGNPNILSVLRVLDAGGYGLGPLLFDEKRHPTLLGHDIQVARYPRLVVKNEVLCK